MNPQTNTNLQGFNIIIGNPPYGANLKEIDRKNYKQIYNISSSNTTQFFIVMANKILTQKGINAFIVPKSLAYVGSWKPLRDSMRDSLCLLVDCSKAFENAKLEMVIYVRHKETRFDSYIVNFLTKNGIINNYEMTIDKNLIEIFNIFPSNLTQQELDIGIKIKQNIKTNLLDMAQCFRGGSFQKDTKKSLDAESYKVLGGKEIKRYFIDDIKGYIPKSTKISNDANIKENSILLQRIIAHIQNPKPHIKFTATIFQDNNYKIVNTIFQIICNGNISNRYILGLLHSRFLNWYAYRFVYAKAIRSMDFSNEIASKLPIPQITESNKDIADEIVALVDKILESKAKDSTTNTSELESH